MNNFNLVLHVAMVMFVKKDNKTNLWYVQNAIVIAGHDSVVFNLL